MRTIAHILLLLSVTLYSLSVPVTWGLYLLRADAIAKAYCVNPGKPSCHGKCHIVKLTTKGEEKNGSPSLVELTIQKPLLFFPDAIIASPLTESPPIVFGQSVPSSLQNGYPFGVYHPPSSVV